MLSIYFRHKVPFLLTSLFLIASAHTTHTNGEKNHLSFTHDDSENFITRWGFQALCDHVYDMSTQRRYRPTVLGKGVTFNPADVKPGDIVFARNIDEFMKEIHPHIQHPYIIVTHGEQNETNHEYQRKYLDEERIIAWFSIHPLKYGHDKYYPIPLCINQSKKWYKQRIKINAYLKKLRTTSDKKMLVYLNVTPSSSPEREQIITLFSDKSFCVKSNSKLQFKDYLEEMAQFKFAFSPRGLGPDSFRTWEALLVGTIPIVRRGAYEHQKNINKSRPCYHSTLDDLYVNLPVLVIDNWEEVTEEFLTKKYDEITSKEYDTRPLYFEYWRDQIYRVRDTFMKKYNAIT